MFTNNNKDQSEGRIYIIAQGLWFTLRVRWLLTESIRYIEVVHIDRIFGLTPRLPHLSFTVCLLFVCLFVCMFVCLSAYSKTGSREAPERSVYKMKTLSILYFVNIPTATIVRESVDSLCRDGADARNICNT